MATYDRPLSIAELSNFILTESDNREMPIEIGVSALHEKIEDAALIAVSLEGLQSVRVHGNDEESRFIFGEGVFPDEYGIAVKTSATARLDSDDAVCFHRIEIKFYEAGESYVPFEGMMIFTPDGLRLGIGLPSAVFDELTDAIVTGWLGSANLSCWVKGLHESDFLVAFKVVEDLSEVFRQKVLESELTIKSQPKP